MQTAPGEVYTALERGVVDGYGWPITGIFDLGWQEKTKYRVDPGFYTAEVSVLVNKTTWDKLTEAQKSRAAQGGERARRKRRQNSRRRTPRTPSGRPMPASRPSSSMAAAGRSYYRAKAYQAGWEGVIRQSPEHGPEAQGIVLEAK